jgi:hypothetical protein
MVPRGRVPPQPIFSEISAGVTVQIAIVPQPVRRAGRESLGDGGAQLDLPLVDVVRLPAAMLVPRVDRAGVLIPTRLRDELHVQAGRQPFRAVCARADRDVRERAVVERESEWIHTACADPFDRRAVEAARSVYAERAHRERRAAADVEARELHGRCRGENRADGASAWEVGQLSCVEHRRNHRGSPIDDASAALDRHDCTEPDRVQ